MHVSWAWTTALPVEMRIVRKKEMIRVFHASTHILPITKYVTSIIPTNLALHFIPASGLPHVHGHLVQRIRKKQGAAT